MIWFHNRGKQSPRYIVPFLIVEKIGLVACRLELPSELARINDVFHVSMLKKCMLDPLHVLEAPLIDLRDELNLEA